MKTMTTNEATTRIIDGITFSIAWTPRCSWRDAGYMVSVVGGPTHLLVMGTSDEAFKAGAAYVAENYEQTPSGWRAKRHSA